MKICLYYLLSLFCVGCYAQQYNVQSLLPKIQDAVFTVFAELDEGVSQGSGFFIAENGIGITNYHVLEGANNAKIKLRDGGQYTISKIMDYDADMDLVKFKIDNKNQLFKSLQIKIGTVQKGESILNLSSPIGLEQTLSTGIVSSLRSDDAHGSVIQITAPISHGSSGSPVLNMEGKVIGVATFGFEEGQSLNFAVSAIQINQLQKNLNIPVSKMGRDPLETTNIQNARKYIQRGEYEIAANCLDTEIKINPKNHIALYTFSKLLYSMSTQHKNKVVVIKDAISASYQASVLKPDCSEYYSQTGMSCILLGIVSNWSGEEGSTAFDMAKSSFDLSLQFDSLNVNALYGMAKLLCEASKVSSRISFTSEQKVNNFKIAINILTLLESVIPSEDFYNYLCIANKNLGNLGKALIYCDKVISFNPEWYRGYFLRGDIKIFDMDMFNEGLLDLEKSIALCDDPIAKADIFSLRGLAYEQKAFKERKGISNFILKAITDYREAYRLTQDLKYKKYEEELIKKFNNSKVSEENI